MLRSCPARPVIVGALGLIAALVAGRGALADPAPPNDNFDDPIVVSSLPFIHSPSTVGATVEPGEPQPCGNIGSTVWYEFTPTSDMAIWASPGYPSDYDMVVAVYTGGSLDDLDLVECDDEFSNVYPYPRVFIGAAAGVTYYFQLGGVSGDAGLGALDLGGVVAGVTALPSALPATAPIPSWSLGTDQILPAVAPASGPGSFAIVDVFCDHTALVTTCPTDGSGDVAPINFTMSKVYPPGQPVAATFTANGEQTLACTDDDDCDLTDRAYEAMGVSPQHVAVGLTGGGQDEIVELTACDLTGYCRSVVVVFVQTILASWSGDPGAVPDPALVFYRCDDIGLYAAESAAGVVPFLWGDPPGGVQASPEVTWEEVFDWFYGIPAGPGGAPAIGNGRLRSPLTVLPMPDIPFYNCGGGTGDPGDDLVTFETDTGILSVEIFADIANWSIPIGNQVFVPFGSLSLACDAGEVVDVLDHPGPVVNTRGWFFPPQPAPPADWCDLDFAPNGVVTYALWDTETATVSAQQPGGTLRTTQVFPPGVTPTPTPTITPTHTPTPTVTPTHTPTPRRAVGGIVGLPAQAGISPAESAVPGEGSGWPAAVYAVLAVGVLAAAMALGGGAWYARRRALR